MILTGRAPVRWPDRDRIDAAWAKETVEVSETAVIDADGLLRIEGEHLPPIRLAGGSHLAPGAAYRLDDPRLSAVRATARIDGRADARTLVAEYRPTHGWLPTAFALGKAPVSVSVDGLDRFRQVRTTSTLPYLAWDATFVPNATEPVTARGRLRWLSVRFVAHVRPSADGHQLECELRVTGRGLWWPVVGVLLAMDGRWGRAGFEEFTQDCARAATDVAEGRGLARPARRDHAAELHRPHQATTISSLRLHRALDEVETLPRWRQTRRAWTAAYDALPDPWWPEPVGDADWRLAERATAATVGTTPRALRRDRIDTLLDHELVFRAGPLEQHASLDEPPLPVVDGQLDLRWLRSPLTLWRYLRSIDSPPAVPAEQAATPSDLALRVD